jgi:hypothetical protein
MQLSGHILAFAFAAPAVLFGLVLAGIPILLHWLFRRPQAVENWAAMDILRRAIAKSAQRLRWQQFTLLAIRTLLIVTVITAAARPVSTIGSVAQTQSGPRDRILLVDRSLSMSSKESDETPLEQAQRYANAILDSAEPGDTFRLLQIGSPGAPVIIGQPSADRAAIAQEVDRLTPTDARADFAPALNLTLKWIEAKANPLAQVIFLSDFQSSDWPASASTTSLQSIGSRADIILAPFGRSAVPNIAITGLAVGDDPLRSGSSTAFEIAVQNNGSEPRSQLPVELRIDGLAAARKAIDLEPNKLATLSIEAPLPHDGEVLLEAVIPDDALLADNRFRRLVRVRDHLNVTVVRHQTSNGQRTDRFLRLGLAPPSPGPAPTPPPNSWVHLTEIEDIDLIAANLDSTDVLWLTGLERLSAEEATRLAHYVNSGGGLIISLAANSDLSNYNARLLDGDTPLLPTRLQTWIEQPLEQAGHFDLGVSPHSVLKPFVGNPDSGLTTTHIWQFAKVEPNPSVTILSLASGEPIILERAIGAGRCVLITTALDDSAGNWSVWPSFVPLIQELTNYAATSSDPSPTLAGQPITFRPAPAPVQMMSPDGGTTTISSDSDGEKPIVSADTPVAGLYTLASENSQATSQRAAVNADPQDSLLIRLTPEQIAARFAGIPHQVRPVWSGETSSTGGDATTPPQEYAVPLLWLAVLLFAAELIVRSRSA